MLQSQLQYSLQATVQKMSPAVGRRSVCIGKKHVHKNLRGLAIMLSLFYQKKFKRQKNSFGSALMPCFIVALSVDKAKSYFATCQDHRQKGA